MKQFNYETLAIVCWENISKDYEGKVPEAIKHLFKDLLTECFRRRLLEESINEYITAELYAKVSDGIEEEAVACTADVLDNLRGFYPIKAEPAEEV